MSMKYSEIGMVVFIEEICQMVYSLLLLMIMYDDKNAFWGLEILWLVSVLFIMSYLTVMGLEFYVAVCAILEIVRRYSDKSLIMDSVLYTQEVAVDGDGDGGDK
jgi:hypothetical protein